MNGYLKRDHCGAWFFCTQAFGHVFDFPFEPGPDLNDSPSTPWLENGEACQLTLQGAVLVERPHVAWRTLAWAGRIDPRSAVVGQERSAG